jgi:septum formation protein
MAKPLVSSSRPLVLASSSRFRQMLLQRLGLEFIAVAPGVDETALPGEAPEALARRLAEAKARRIGDDYPGSLIIGSDQVAVLDGRTIGKPGSHDAAVAQLAAASGRTLRFFTALALWNPATERLQLDVIPYSVTFRKLAAADIESYLRREQPYDCAGAFKSEGLGIALMERLDGNDPTALIGLPLIRLTQMLEAEGVKIF